MLIGCWNPSSWKAYFAQRSSAVAWGRAQHFGSNLGQKVLRSATSLHHCVAGETSYATEIWYIHLHYIDRERERDTGPLLALARVMWMALACKPCRLSQVHKALQLLGFKEWHPAP